MTTAVTVDDVANWLGITVRGPVVDGVLSSVLNAVVANVGPRLGSWVPDPWPADVDEAIVMQSARIYKRRNSPEGVAGFGDLGVVRVVALDPDVESMIGTSLAFHFGGALPVIDVYQ